MIIRELTLENFGVYGGQHTFNLRPNPSHHFNRPIVLLSGKNGVGKTTFVEAIRLCLHGSIALGNRVGQQEYERYLRKRIHRPPAGHEEPHRAVVRLLFDYVSEGRKHLYKVERKWRRLRASIQEEISIWEDDEPLVNLGADQKEEFLRELIPPGVADLFFFDGEQIRTLAERDEGNLLLGDTVKSLLGLNLVNQLEKDLDIYISRQRANKETAELQAQLKELRAEADEYAQSIAQLEIERQKVIEDVLELNELIEHQEQQIAVEGGWFAKQREELLEKLHRLQVNIERVSQQAQEMCVDLVPFAIAPEMLNAVSARLDKEHAYQEWQSNRKFVAKQIEQLRLDLEQERLWVLGSPADTDSPSRLLDRIEQSLWRTLPEQPVADEEVFLHASEKKRRILQQWIDDAQDAVPRRFSSLLLELNELESERAYLQAELEKVPPDETLAPLVTRLNELHQELGAAQRNLEQLDNEISRLSFHQEQVISKLRKVRERLAEQASDDERVQLAARTQSVLEEYERRLTQAKLERLQSSIVERFNELCSKEQFIKTATIDPQHFTITLFRDGEPFQRTELSAGERQLLAIATMWALREVSDRPAPVIVDTPLSRLDSEHRQRMIDAYLPRVSHQVIVLATDAEIDQQLRQALAPELSHVYHLTYDSQTGSTKSEMEELKFSTNGNSIVELDRIVVK